MTGASHWTMNGTQARIGSSAFGGDFALDRNRNPPHLKAQVRGSRLALRDLARPWCAAAPQRHRKRALPQRRFDLPALRVMDADASLAFDDSTSTAKPWERCVRSARSSSWIGASCTSRRSRPGGRRTDQRHQPSRRHAADGALVWPSSICATSTSPAGWRGWQKGEAASRAGKVIGLSHRSGAGLASKPMRRIRTSPGLIDADIGAQGSGISTAIHPRLARTARRSCGCATARCRTSSPRAPAWTSHRRWGVALRGDDALPLR
jgi:hypothetical protein